MTTETILGKPLPNMPWQDRRQGSSEIMWRFAKNAVVDKKPLKDADRIFNSAVIPYQGEFIGVFRADHKNGYPNLHLGRSNDAINWQIEEEIIRFQTAIM